MNITGYYTAFLDLVTPSSSPNLIICIIAGFNPDQI